MSYKTRKYKSKTMRMRHNKTRGGGKYKDKKRGHSTTSGSTYNPPKKVSPNTKRLPPIYAIPKNEWNALTIEDQRRASVHGVGPNK
jgi:hypothetical protein